MGEQSKAKIGSSKSRIALAQDPLSHYLTPSSLKALPSLSRAGGPAFRRHLFFAHRHRRPPPARSNHRASLFTRAHTLLHV